VLWLSKILPLFVLPVGITLILLVGGLIWRRALIWVAVVFLWLASTPIVSRTLIRAVEGRFERVAPASVAPADAIVVLSGGRMLAPGSPPVSEWEDADRFFAGIELFRAERAPLLVFTGGWVPWIAEAPPEGDILKAHAIQLGVPSDRIVCTGTVSNTAEEATAVLRVLRERLAHAPRVLLVTSAFHMPRAQLTFERTGLQVIPFPVDFRTSVGVRQGIRDLLPGATELAQTQLAVREIYGRWFYRLMFQFEDLSS
jgi:uncharacterized SAM-binding protein YcdF (DUF218 family)